MCRARWATLRDLFGTAFPPSSLFRLEFWQTYPSHVHGQYDFCPCQKLTVIWKRYSLSYFFGRDSVPNASENAVTEEITDADAIFRNVNICPRVRPSIIDGTSSSDQHNLSHSKSSNEASLLVETKNIRSTATLRRCLLPLTKEERYWLSRISPCLAKLTGSSILCLCRYHAPAAKMYHMMGYDF